jgi:hypothetical protein
VEQTVEYCEHCEGQRFDRARVLRALRQLRRQMPPGDRRGAEALDLAVQTIRALDIPHLEVLEIGDEIIH